MTLFSCKSYPETLLILFSIGGHLVGVVVSKTVLITHLAVVCGFVVVVVDVVVVVVVVDVVVVCILVVVSSVVVSVVETGASKEIIKKYWIINLFWPFLVRHE